MNWCVLVDSYENRKSSIFTEDQVRSLGRNISYWKIFVNVHLEVFYVFHALYARVVTSWPRPNGLVVSVSASHAVGHRFAPPKGYTQDHHKMVHTVSLLGGQALG